MSKTISDRAVGRLTQYRRALTELQGETSHLFSYQLAQRVGVSAAQLRRDLMLTGYEGSPNRGYEITPLLHSLSSFLDGPHSQNAALVGVGNLGRALLAYFTNRNPHLQLTAAFDIRSDLDGQVLHGCRIHHVDHLEDVLSLHHITMAILAVPQETAQEMAHRLAHAGVTGILNFAPRPLDVPSQIHVEQVDLTMALEKLAYFAQRKQEERNRA